MKAAERDPDAGGANGIRALSCERHVASRDRVAQEPAEWLNRRWGIAGRHRLVRDLDHLEVVELAREHGAILHPVGPLRQSLDATQPGAARRGCRGAVPVSERAHDGGSGPRDIRQWVTLVRMTTMQTTGGGVDWGTLAAASPRIADVGLQLLNQSGEGAGLLATVRGDAPPRIHPVNVGVVGDGLYTFLLASPKRRDLEVDGRYALHAHQDPAAPGEFSVRGRAIPVGESGTRERVAAAWPFGVDDGYALFELRIESALLGERETADTWPPSYTSWRPGGT